MKAPIYREFFVPAREGEEGAFPVFYPDFSGETKGYRGFLRPGRWDELQCHLQKDTIYVRVEHPLEWPYSAWDCEEDRPLGEDDWDREIFDEDEKVRYCQAAVVFTPKMALI